MNAPKKIWFTPDEELASAGKLDDEDIPYIRADIVDELVETLKHLGEYCHDAEFWYLHEVVWAALAKLEESHE